MIVDLDVPRGRKLFLLAGEIDPNPTMRDEVVWAVAVHREAGRMVLLQGHTCTADGDCAKGWCFQAHVPEHAIRANLDGDR